MATPSDSWNSNHFMTNHSTPKPPPPPPPPPPSSADPWPPAQTDLLRTQLHREGQVERWDHQRAILGLGLCHQAAQRLKHDRVEEARSCQATLRPRMYFSTWRFRKSGQISFLQQAQADDPGGEKHDPVSLHRNQVVYTSTSWLTQKLVGTHMNRIIYMWMGWFTQELVSTHMNRVTYKWTGWFTHEPVSLHNPTLWPWSASQMEPQAGLSKAAGFTSQRHLSQLSQSWVCVTLSQTAALPLCFWQTVSHTPLADLCTLHFLPCQVRVTAGNWVFSSFPLQFWTHAYCLSFLRLLVTLNIVDMLRFCSTKWCLAVVKHKISYSKHCGYFTLLLHKMVKWYLAVVKRKITYSEHCGYVTLFFKSWGKTKNAFKQIYTSPRKNQLLTSSTRTTQQDPPSNVAESVESLWGVATGAGGVVATLPWLPEERCWIVHLFLLLLPCSTWCAAPRCGSGQRPRLFFVGGRWGGWEVEDVQVQQRFCALPNKHNTVDRCLPVLTVTLTYHQPHTIGHIYQITQTTICFSKANCLNMFIITSEPPSTGHCLISASLNKNPHQQIII